MPTVRLPKLNVDGFRGEGEEGEVSDTRGIMCASRELESYAPARGSRAHLLSSTIAMGVVLSSSMVSIIRMLHHRAPVVSLSD